MHDIVCNFLFLQDGFTALKWAAQDELTDILECLIEAGADVNKHYRVKLLLLLAILLLFIT